MSPSKIREHYKDQNTESLNYKIKQTFQVECEPSEH